MEGTPLDRFISCCLNPARTPRPGHPRGRGMGRISMLTRIVIALSIGS